MSTRTRARGKRGAGRSAQRQEPPVSMCEGPYVAPQPGLIRRWFHAFIALYLTAVYNITKFLGCLYRSIVASIDASVTVTNKIFVEAFSPQLHSYGVKIGDAIPCAGPLTELKLPRGSPTIFTPVHSPYTNLKPPPREAYLPRAPKSDEIDQFMLDTLMDKIGEPHVNVAFKQPVNLDEQLNTTVQSKLDRYADASHVDASHVDATDPHATCTHRRDAGDHGLPLCRDCMWNNRVERATDRMYERAFGTDPRDNPRAKRTISCNCVREPGDPHIGLCGACTRKKSNTIRHDPDNPPSKRVFRHANSPSLSNILIRGKAFAPANKLTTYNGTIMPENYKARLADNMLDAMVKPTIHGKTTIDEIENKMMMYDEIENKMMDYKLTDNMVESRRFDDYFNTT